MTPKSEKRARAWMLQAAAAIVLLITAFAVVGGRYAWARAVYAPQPETEQTVQASRWATVTMDAPVFEGCGMYTRMLGSVQLGDGVEVLSTRNGYAKILHYRYLSQPVYISTEYLAGVR